MKYLLLSVLALLLLCSSSSWAKPHASINGNWTSTTGAIITVDDASADNDYGFTIKEAQPGGAKVTYEAFWMSGDEVKFYYMLADESIYGVYNTTTDVISLSNPNTDYRATWTR